MGAVLVMLLVFRDIAATMDGGAYLWSQDGSKSVLERVILDGGRLPVTIDGAHRIEAIGTRGNALWIVTPTEVIVRASWTSPDVVRVAIPANENSIDARVRETTVTPIGNGRALVMRACRDAGTVADDCTDVITVDTVAGTHAVRTWPAQLSNAVPDERGGAWMRVDVRANAGYGHASDSGWDLWSADGAIVPGMMAHPRSEAFPAQLAAAPDGFWGIWQHTIWPIDESGVPRARMKYDEVGHRGVSEVLGARSSGGEIVLLTGIHDVCCGTEDEHDDTSPVIRWITHEGVERASDIAPTPRWWREEHGAGTPPARFSVAAGVAWFAFDDLVMMRNAEWHVIAERGRAAKVSQQGDRDDNDDNDDEIGARRFWSCTATLGYSRAGDDDGFAWGIRWERMSTANKKRPVLGAGAYVEINSLGGRKTATSGLSFGLMRYGAIASVGASVIEDVADRWHPQLVASLFLGKRLMLDTGSLEAPIGVRFEIRPGTADLPTTFMLATSLDLLVVTAAALLASAM